MDQTSSPPVKGVNRCPAVSFQELLDLDPVETPAFMRIEAPADFGTEPIPASRYTSQDFFRREVAAVWHRTWQYACREEQLPNPGDSHVYDLAGKSAIVVRQTDGSLRALRNVCLHRGRKLLTHGGCNTRFKCPYHGFTWNIDGDFSENPMPWDFPLIDEANFALPRIAVDSWGGFIFVNFDPEAPSLASVADPLPEHFGHWGIADCYQSAHVGKVVSANWKAVVEAFLESHHVHMTHPQLTPYTGDANSQYDILSDHVCRFITPLGTPSPLIDSTDITPQKLVDTWFAKGSRAGPMGEENIFREGDNPREFAASLARKTWGEKTGKDLSNTSQTELIDAISYNMFPAFSIWGGVGSHIGYRWRPWEGRVDRTLMEVYLFAPLAPDSERPAPAPFRMLKESEAWKDAPELGYLGGVFDQDQVNLQPVQEGLEDLGEDGVIQFGRYSEIRCRNLHRMVDRYIEQHEEQ